MTVRTRRDVDAAGPEPATPDVLDWTLKADTLVDRIEDDGTIHFQWSGADWEVGPVGGDVAVGDRLEARLDALPGFTVDGIADGSGLLRQAILADADSLHERVQPMFDNLRMGVLEFLAALPRVPVGVGAKWQVARWTDRLGVRFMQEVTYELISVEGHRIDLNLTTALIAPSESGMTFVGQGRGRLRVDLTQIVPAEFDSGVQGTFETATGQGGEARSERGTFSIHVEMHRRR